jgi:polysaccharide biosynthesis transport protein
MDDQQPLSATWELYQKIIRRRRWWLFVPTFLCWAIVWGVSWFVPSLYRSEALILVEQQRVPEHYVEPNVAVDLQERLQSMTQQILSRTRLLSIIDQLHLYASERSRQTPDEIVELMRKDIKIDLVQAQAAGRPEELTAFKISYLNHDPKLAQQVTSDLTSFFIGENLRAREQASEDTTNFLDNQLQDARQHLEDQEQRLREFKGRYLGQLPSQLQSNLQILSGFQERLQDENERLGRAEQQKVYLNSMISQYRALTAQIREGKKEGENSPVSLDEDLEKLRNDLTELRAKYTERHPDVVRLKDQIVRTEALKKQVDAELEAASKATNTEGTDPDLQGADPKTASPILELESQLKANELEIENRKREIKQIEAATEDYKSRLNETPVREQQLADLTRDYDQSRANYESLLAKRNQSELATNLEKRQQGEQFRVIDPPSLPEKPYWPNRLLLSLGGIAGGLVLGGIGTALVETIDDRVHQSEDLVALAPIPVLAIVPPLITQKEQRWQFWGARLEVVAALLITAIIVCANVFTYYKG